MNEQVGQKSEPLRMEAPGVIVRGAGASGDSLACTRSASVAVGARRQPNSSATSNAPGSRIACAYLTAQTQYDKPSPSSVD